MTSFLYILGRQPELGLAELEALTNAESVVPVGENCALVDTKLNFDNIGSSVKCAELIGSVDGADIKKAFRAAEKVFTKELSTLPSEGKIKIGISVYGFDVRPFDINGAGLKLKKIAKQAGRSARVVPNETPALSSAQTYHNSLAKELGVELVFVRDTNQIMIGRVNAVQDIDAYRIRDRERPKRDAFVGMLPPKLAQTMINLARVKRSGSLWDPFCGTGVILLEALMQEIDVFGSDISEKMVKYTNENINWLMNRKDLSSGRNEKDIRAKVFVGDAASVKLPLGHAKDIQSVVSETYLGQPLGGQSPSEEKIHDIMHGVNATVRGFLKNIASQVAAGSRHCIALPAWHANNTVYHLPVLDDLAELGFERVAFTHASELIYRREDQVTGRELVVLVKT